MKKRIVSLLLAAVMVMGMLSGTVLADSSPSITASSTSTYAGNWFNVDINAQGLSALGTLELDIFYDANALNYEGYYSGWLINDSMISVNGDTPGQIRVTLLSLNGISGDGQLLGLNFMAKSNCEVGSYKIQPTIGEAYDTGRNEVSISGVSGTVTVQQGTTNYDPFYIYSGWNNGTSGSYGSTFQMETYNSWGRYIAGAGFTIEYDKECLRVDSVTLDSALMGEGAVYSVDTGTPGIVKISFASVHEVYAYRLFTANFTAIADVTEQTQVKVSVTEAYNQALTPYAPQSETTTLYLTKLPETVDPPDVWLELTDENAVLILDQTTTTDFRLQDGANVAAADFTITYNPQVLNCVAVTAAKEATEQGAMIVINPGYTNGTIRFSYVNEDGKLTDGTPLVQIQWKPVKFPVSHDLVTISGSGVVDADYADVALEYLKYSNCVYHVQTVDPTCTEKGHVQFVCVVCGDSYNGGETAALGHNPGEETRENEVFASCSSDGHYDVVVYCTRCSKELSRTHVEVPSTGDHVYSTEKKREEATCTADGYKVMACTCGAEQTVTIPSPGHGYQTVVTEPTCTAGGYTTHTCTRCGDSYVSDEVAALPHTPGEEVRENEVFASCSSDGHYDVAVYCTSCGTELSRTHVEVPSTGDHVYATEKRREEATCTADGYKVMTCTCGAEQTVTIPSPGHDYQAVVTEPTCTAGGYTTYTCSRCGNSYTANQVSSLGHKLTYVDAQKVTCTAKGWDAYEYCSRCDYTTYREISATGHSYGNWVTVLEPTVTATGKRERTCGNCGDVQTDAIPALNNKTFTDVPAGQWYSDAVQWAVANEITSGTGDGTTFSPTNPCTRAHVVTFLWRSAGSPEPTGSNPFTDVPEGQWYTKAVLWAVENGITSGKGDGTIFMPNATCSRAEVVTFLWRAAGSPAPTGTNAFIDVADGQWYTNAIIWAVEQGITSGTGNGSTFSPTNPCTRAHVVTFLYRYKNN